MSGPSSSQGGLAAHQQEPWAAEFSLNKIRVLVGIAAAVAITGTCNRSEGHGCSAHIGMGLHRGAHLVNFVDGQLTSAFPYKYSVVFLSRHKFFLLCFFKLHPLAQVLRSGTKCVLVRAAFGQVCESELARRAGSAYAFDFFLT
jgi:hypothetical protein